jgi:acetyl-CoA carboxylase biotin carboxyl carrier protein
LSKKENHKRNGGRSGAGAPPPSLASSGPMDVRLLEQLVKLMTENSLSTVELSDGDKRITLKRGVDTGAVAAPAYSYAPPAPAPSLAAAPQAAEAAAEDDSKLIPIKSPMPGTFYAAPAKGAKPFVSVGAKVDEESDVCIVEAMKVFNTLKAEARGVITKILVQDSQPVEFGQVLFLIKPN